nr:gypsy/Ty3 retroelement polyprotein [Tanacetum cinerariifolium]
MDDDDDVFDVLGLDSREAILQRFGVAYDDPLGEIKKLRQTSSVQDYINIYDMLLCKVDFPKDQCMSFFLAGLNSDISLAVRMFRGAHLGTNVLDKYSLLEVLRDNTETEDSNSETASSKSEKESSLNSATKDVHAIKYKMSKAKERCMTYFRSLHSHLQVLSKEDLKGTRIEHGFKRAFMTLFGQDADTFTKSEVQDDNSRPGNDTDADDAYIRPIYDEEPMAK